MDKIHGVLQGRTVLYGEEIFVTAGLVGVHSLYINKRTLWHLLMGLAWKFKSRF